MALQYSNLAVWEMNLDDYTINRSHSHDALFDLKDQQKTGNSMITLRCDLLKLSLNKLSGFIQIDIT